MTRWIVLAAGWLLIGASLPMTLDAGWFGKLPGWAVFFSPYLLPANLCFLCSPALLAVRRQASGRWIARVVSLLMLEPGALMVYSLVADGTTDLPPAIILYTVGNVIACISVWLPSGPRRPSTAPGGFPVVRGGRVEGSTSTLDSPSSMATGLDEAPGDTGEIAARSGMPRPGAHGGAGHVLEYRAVEHRAVTAGRLATAGVSLSCLSIICSVLVGAILAFDRGLGLAFHLPLQTKDGTLGIFSVAAICFGIAALGVVFMAGFHHAMRWRWAWLTAIGDLLSLAGAALWLQSNGWFG